jgi:HlyD family secretion protein
MNAKTLFGRTVIVVLAGALALAAWQAWRIAHRSLAPEGIVLGNVRIESVQVEIAAKYGGRIKEIGVREGTGRDGAGSRHDGYG